jgi:FkbM family methyltransferase
VIKNSIPGTFRRVLRILFYNKLVENLFFLRGARRQINGETINIPLRFSRYYPSFYEAEKTEFIKKNCKPGSTAIDIGAHIGIFSFFLAKQVGNQGKVYSFEPTPLTFKVLQKTIQFNHLEKIVEARQQAVSDSDRDVIFHVYENSSISNANSISTPNDPDRDTKPIKVSAVHLDGLLADLNQQDLSFIKIDAEGAELDILKGGEKIIKKYKPYITLEVHPKSFEEPFQKQKEIFRLVKSFGYTVSRDNKDIDENEFCNIGDCFEVFLTPA